MKSLFASLLVFTIILTASPAFSQGYNYHHHDHGDRPVNKYDLYMRSLDAGRDNLERRRAADYDTHQRRLDSDRDYELRKQELELRRQEIELQRRALEIEGATK
jgi:hypothetical protein